MHNIRLFKAERIQLPLAFPYSVATSEKEGKNDLPLPHFHRLMHTVIPQLLLFAAPTSHNVSKIPSSSSNFYIFYLLQLQFSSHGRASEKAMTGCSCSCYCCCCCLYCPAWLHLLFHQYFCFVSVVFYFLPHLAAHLKRFSTRAACFSLVALKRRFNSHFTWRGGTAGSSATPTMPRCTWLPGHKWQSKLHLTGKYAKGWRRRTDCHWELLSNIAPQLKIQPKVGNTFYT